MPYNVNATFSENLAQSSGGSPIIDMYVLNASLTGADYLYYANYNQDIYGFELNASGNLTATEVLYTGFSIERDAVKSDTSGEITEIQLSIPNIDRQIESIIQNYNYLRGCPIYFVTAFGANLPSGSTANHIGTITDKNAVVTDKLYIDGTSSSTEAVGFSCKPKFVIKNIILPARRHTPACSWDYLSNDCDPYKLINTASYPKCKKTINECDERKNTERYGGFVSIPKRGIYIIS